MFRVEFTDACPAHRKEPTVEVTARVSPSQMSPMRPRVRWAVDPEPSRGRGAPIRESSSVCAAARSVEGQLVGCEFSAVLRVSTGEGRADANSDVERTTTVGAFCRRAIAVTGVLLWRNPVDSIELS